MSALEIIIFILGIIFVVLSIFIVEHSASEEKAEAEERQIRELTVDEEKYIRDKVREIIEDEEAKTYEDTQAKLNRLSNEKIMAVDEFSEQVIEKIRVNHQEVVFLYDMLQKKQEDLKSTLLRLEQYRKLQEQRIKDAKQKQAEAAAVRGEAWKTEQDAADAAIQQNLARKGKSIKEEADEGLKRQAVDTMRTVTRPISVTRKESVSDESENDGKQVALNEAITKLFGSGSTEKPPEQTAHEEETASGRKLSAMGSGSSTARILELHKQKKSVIEISKLLGLGQGEVKLVIDLYGN